MEKKYIPLQCEVLEYHKLNFSDKSGKSVDYANCVVRYDGRLLKLKVKLPLDLSASVDKIVTLGLSIVPDEKLYPVVKVVALL